MTTEQRTVTAAELALAIWREMEEYSEYEEPPYAAVAWADAIFAHFAPEPERVLTVRDIAKYGISFNGQPLNLRIENNVFAPVDLGEAG